MKSTKKLLLAAGIVLHSVGAIYAGDWTAAFNVFGGRETAEILANGNGHGTITLTNALKIVNSADNENRAELLAIARALVPNKNVSQIPPSPFSDADVAAAAQAIVNAIRSAEQPVQQPVQQTVQQQQVPANSWGWFGGSSATQNANSASAANELQKAVEAQKQADMIALQKAVEAQKQSDINFGTAGSQALANIASSGKSGVNLYTAFIDYIFSALQVAINSIADVSTQQQVISYIQSKFAGMKATVAANNYNARVMGRMGGSESFKHKNSHQKKSKKSKNA